MFANIKRKKLKITKRDYRKSADAPIDYFLFELTKDERKFMALARPDWVVIIPRFTLICELIEPANAEHKQRTNYLASISEKDLTLAYRREQFWRVIDKKLSRLKLAPEVESTARAKINKSVPRPPIENQ
jgi:hypothetical protein